MRGFLYKIVFFALMVLAVLVGLECYVRSLPNPSRDKHQYMLAHSTSVRTLVLGQSHAFYGINPALLGDSAYSLAQVSQTLRYDEWLLKHYPMPNVRTVILAISNFSLFEDFEVLEQDDYVARYRIYMDCNIHPFFSFYNIECAHWNSFKQKVSSLWLPKQLEWSPQTGFGLYRLSSRKADFDNGEERARVNTYIPDVDSAALSSAPSQGSLRVKQYIDIAQDNFQRLLRIAEWCDSHQARLVLVFTPTLPSFYHNESKTQQRLTQNYIHQLRTAFPKVALFDYERSTSFSDSCFYDSDHLSDYGANRFTRMLKSRLKELDGAVVR